MRCPCKKYTICDTTTIYIRKVVHLNTILKLRDGSSSVMKIEAYKVKRRHEIRRADKHIYFIDIENEPSADREFTTNKKSMKIGLSF